MRGRKKVFFDLECCWLFYECKMAADILIVNNIYLTGNISFALCVD